MSIQTLSRAEFEMTYRVAKDDNSWVRTQIVWVERRGSSEGTHHCVNLRGLETAPTLVVATGTTAAEAEAALKQHWGPNEF